jgi:DNA-binding PadR family transcriptional regulator
MLELAVLGLLQREPLHGYRLTKDLELFMGCCMTINSGAVYPLLRRLEQRGDVSALSEPQDGASSRIMYCITEQGRQRWLEKMRSHPNESWVNSRARFMIKVFFFQDLLPQYRAELLEYRLMQCRLKQQRIQDEKTTRSSLNAYQLATFHHGTQLLTIEVEWLSQLLEQERLVAFALSQPLTNDIGELP